MGTEIRRNRPYVYRKERVDGRVQSRYVGPAGSEFARLMVRMAAVARGGRGSEAAYAAAGRAEAEAVDAEVARVARQAKDLAGLAMAAAGFHRHARGPWRRRRAMKGVTVRDAGGGPEEVPAGRAELDAFQDRAVAGDETTRRAFRRLFADNPGALVDLMGGDLAARAEARLIARLDGPNVVRQEALKAKLGAIRAELAGPDPTPIERLLAERAATCWLAAGVAECEAADARGPAAHQAERRAAAANARYATAIRTLASVRRLAVPEIRATVNLDARTVNVTPPQPAAIEAPAAGKPKAIRRQAGGKSGASR